MHIQNTGLVYVIVGRDKPTNRIANMLLLLSAHQQWHRNSADMVPAHQTVGYWVRAQRNHYQHLRYKEVSIRKKKSGRSELEERERTNISAFAVSFLGLHAAINQPKGMLQSKVLLKKKKTHDWSTHSELEPKDDDDNVYAQHDRECIRDCVGKKIRYPNLKKEVQSVSEIKSVLAGMVKYARFNFRLTL